MAIVERTTDREADLDLVRRMARGDEDAVRRAYGAHADPLYRFALRRVGGSAEDAEEIVNDVFLVAIRHGGNFEG